MLKAIVAQIIAAALAAAAAVILTQPAHAQKKTKTERLLGESLNEFASDENGWTHLHWAALANDPEAARKLLETGATHSPLALGDNSPFSADGQRKAGLLGHDMEKWTNRKQTPVMVADAFKNTIVISILVEHGAFFLDALRGTPPPKAEWLYYEELNISAKDWDGKSHLHRAAKRNDLTAAQWLIANGAEVNPKQSNEWTPLHYAARFNATEIAALLLENGAEVNAKNENDATPLDWAIFNEDSEMQALLRAHDALCNEEC